MRGSGPRWLASVLAVTSVLAACDGSTTAPRPRPARPTVSRSRTIDETMKTADGRVRTYRVHVPGGLGGNRRVPMVLALHGGVGSGRQFERNSGFDVLADAHRFVVVYPDGIEIGGSSVLATGHVWNGGRCCGAAATENVDDVGFLTRVVDSVTARYGVDPRQVFAVGHSNGAIMAYRLACERAAKIAAIGVQAGTLEVDGCAPARPVSVLHIHGSADRNLPIGGGRGAGLSAVAFFPPKDAVEILARADRCPAAPRTRRDRENPDVTTAVWSPCAERTAVEFVTVTGASHAWMGHPSSRSGANLTGEPYPGFDSSAAIWSFLVAHPRSG